MSEDKQPALNENPQKTLTFHHTAFMFLFCTLKEVKQKKKAEKKRQRRKQNEKCLSGNPPKEYLAMIDGCSAAGPTPNWFSANTLKMYSLNLTRPTAL